MIIAVRVVLLLFSILFLFDVLFGDAARRLSTLIINAGISIVLLMLSLLAFLIK